MLQIAGNYALRQKHKDKKIRTHLAKTRTKESTAFRFGSSQVQTNSNIKFGDAGSTFGARICQY